MRGAEGGAVRQEGGGGGAPSLYTHEFAYSFRVGICPAALAILKSWMWGPAHPSLPATAGDHWTGGSLSSPALAHLEAVSLHPLSHIPFSAPAALRWLILGSTPQLCL